MIVEVSDVPIIADADTGFGGPLNITRTIAMYEAAGLAGCHIEGSHLLDFRSPFSTDITFFFSDQTFPKRCDQLEDKGLLTWRPLNALQLLKHVETATS